MRPPLHTHSTLACLLDADPLDSLLQIIARAHLGVQEHPAYRRGERKPLLRSLLGSGARAQSARARLSESGSVAQASGHAGVSFTLHTDTARS